jgi:very-short-patch-repair endonuclease
MAAPLRGNEPDLDKLIEDYLAGRSILQLSKELGVSRPTITRRLQRAGIEIRDMSDAHKVMWSTLKHDRGAMERHLGKAWDATRGREVGDRALLAQHHFERQNQTVGMFEGELAGHLRLAGVDVKQQFAVGRYNLDLALDEPAVAVEILGSRRGARLIAQFLQRTEYLLDRGWSVIVVLCWGTTADASDRALPIDTTQKLLAYHEAGRRDESLLGRYGMIGGERYPRSARRYEFEHLPAIPGLHPGYKVA